MTDQEAIARLIDGDEAGLEALVEAYGQRAYSLAAVMVGDRDEAQEVASDAFLKVFRSRSRLDPERGFWPWLATIVANEARSAIRRRRRRERLERILKLHLPAPQDPTLVAEVRYLEDWALDALNILPAPERQALQLRLLLDLDERAIGEIMGCPVGTVKTRLHRGRRRLKELAKRDLQGYLPEALDAMGGPHA